MNLGSQDCHMQNSTRAGDRRPDFIMISWLLRSFSIVLDNSHKLQVPYHKMNATCKRQNVTERTAPISAFHRTPWHNGTRLWGSVFLSRMFWFMSQGIIDGLQPFQCISADPCRKASISCSQNPIWPEDAIERTFFLSINPHMKRF